jgi:hypothetical protein
MSLKKFKKAAVAAALVGGFAVQGSAQAFVVGSLTCSDSTACAVWDETTPGSGLLEKKVVDLASAQAALDGPGNVELGTDDGLTMGTLTGEGVTLMNVGAAEWTANGNAAALQYVTDAYNYATTLLPVDPGLTPGDLQTIADAFVNTGVWTQVSDPNIVDVNVAGDVVGVTLGGFLDATPVLTGLFPALVGLIPDGAQVSEVVKVTYNGVTKLLYGFSAVDSGVASADGRESYTGNYSVRDVFTGEVPVPATLGLLLIGAAAMRRRFA